MKLNTSNPLGVLCLFFSIITLFSCSKDSDLMADYVALDPDVLIGKYVKSDSYVISIISNSEEDNYEIAINSGNDVTIVNDTYQISSSASIVLDVLANDTFKNLENVSIIETSQPSSGSIVINSDNTLTYTPETTESITDTFTYTAQVVNEDQSVTTEEGTVILEVTNSANKYGTIELNTLKAFPSAFGAGQNLTGGRGGSYYAVTNLNNSGSGSFREALSQGDGTIIIIQVEGIVHLTSPISGRSTTPKNTTIWGQFAPGNGLTLSDDRITFEGANNWITRFMTFQNRNSSGCPDPQAGGSNCRSSVGWREMNDSGGLGVYVDHVSARWGLDQTMDIGHGQPTQFSTMAYNFIAQGAPGHNTGGFAGGAGGLTYARNAFVSLSHRFAIHSGGGIENYNNYIVNYGSRIANARTNTQIDYFHNYVERGNANGRNTNATNKLEGSGIGGFRTYTANNFVQHIDESPSGLQTNLWQNRNGPEGPNYTAIDSYHYVGGRLNNFGDPEDGVWHWRDVKEKVLSSAGHNRGINADGSPGYFRDDVDDDFASRAKNGTTRSTRLTADQFFNSASTSTSMYADTDGDYMPDWFENQHPHLDANVDDKNEKHVEWNFGEYNVLNNAGYTNLEICAEFYAGGFEIMIDGVND